MLKSKKAKSWLILVIISLILLLAMEALQLPAALVLGPMMAAIIMVLAQHKLRIQSPVFFMAQGVVGMMIATHIPTTIFSQIADSIGIFLIGTFSTVVTSYGLGWLLARARLLPGTTAIWGSSPGAASAMSVMSESFGADMRLVACMQYLRVVCCVLASTLVAKLLGHSGGELQQTNWFAVNSYSTSILTVALTLICVFIGIKVKMPGGALLLPMIVGLCVKFTGISDLELPSFVLAIGYACLGWGIGFRFTIEVLRHALKLLPYLLAAIIALIFVNGLFALILVHWAGIDMLTAFLATSPGGADSVAIIASSTDADLPFIMTMQIGRFIVVLLTGPIVAKWLSNHKSLRNLTIKES